MLRFRPTFWPTLFTITGVIILVTLGLWQIERLRWKLDIIATIEARSKAEPVALPPNAAIDPDALEYRRVTVSGRLRHDREIHLLSHTYRGNLGYHLYVPLERSDGGVLFVNRGWVPADKKDPASRPGSQPSGEVRITGYLRKPWHQGWFVPDNDAARNQWFFADLDAMARQAGVAAPPLYVEAGPTPEGSLPIGGQTRLEVTNNHLQYALTWFAFAILLVIIYVLYHRKLERERS